MTQLTIKNRKFINAVVSGKTQTQAYVEAYDTQNMSRKSIHEEASRTSRKPQVRKAIEDALISQQLTPEYAVLRLKEVLVQSDNYASKRLAVKDALALWGIKI